MKKKIVLAYSGGLDTSVILKWLQENYNAEVICYTADIGQEINRKKIISNAKKFGVKNIIIKDLKDVFVKEYVFPMIRGHAIYEGVYLLGTSIARPLIAKDQIKIAKKFKAYAVSHGATGKGNDQVRFELGYHFFGPKIKIIAPGRINGKKLKPSKLLEKLNQLAGKNGIGRVDLVENRFLGIKSRGVYETPGGTLLIHAHRAIESVTLDKETMHKKDNIMSRYAELIYNGYWYSKERFKLQKVVDLKKNKVSGSVKLKLYKGNIIIQSRVTKSTAYSLKKVSFEENKSFNKSNVEKFINFHKKKLRN